MDDLFTVYRYLANNRHLADHQNPYNVAYRALDSYVEIGREIASYARIIRTTGGLLWEDAEKLTASIHTSFAYGLSTHYGDALPAAIHFMQKYLTVDDIGDLIDACEREQVRMQREEDEEDEIRAEEKRQFLLDSGRMIEDQ